MSTTKQRLQLAIKEAMKARQKLELGTLRMFSAAIKQKEVDERRELDDAAVVSVLDKLVKQRRESIAQFEQAGRDDLVAQETEELNILLPFLPAPLSPEAVEKLVDEAVADIAAKMPSDMGKVMTILKPKVAGRVDMRQVSQLVKSRLAQLSDS